MRRALAIALGWALLSHAALPAQTPPAPPVPAPAVDSMALRPGDVLQIRIWNEEDLSGDFVVDESGGVILPQLGARRVADIPIGRLRDELRAAYGVYLRNPSISITPLRRVIVLGEVNRPGLVPVDPTVTLSGAVGLAGGATATGDLRRIRVVRDGRIYLQRANQGFTLRDMDIRSGDQIIVDRRSWFDRNSTFLVSALLSVTSIVTTILVRS
jgi:protein involved in polysaccharide export with SLBB domain